MGSEKRLTSAANGKRFHYDPQSYCTIKIEFTEFMHSLVAFLALEATLPLCLEQLAMNALM